MSAPIEPADDDLQFNTAEPAITAVETPAAVCARCKKPLGATYYAIGNHPLCAECREVLQPEVKGGRPKRLLKATGLGIGAALLGAVIWFAVRKITNMEIGLIAVVVGYLVGRAVRMGSGNRGGRAYQVIAVLLTYCGIAANYMPDVAQSLWEKAHDKPAATQPAEAGTPGAVQAAAVKAGETAAPATAPASTPHKKPSLGLALLALVVIVALIFVISLAAPFLVGFQNIIGLLIIGFALWEAWKLNRRVALPITGPYQTGPTASVP